MLKKQKPRMLSEANKRILRIICIFLFLIGLFASAMVIDNQWELPFAEPSSYVDHSDYVGGENVAVDINGNELNDWQGNNPADDIIKAGLVLVTLGTLFYGLGLAIRSVVARIIIVLIAIPFLLYLGLLLVY